MAKKVTRKATPADAGLILNLYDLRREARMREARDYMTQQFWPATLDEFKQVMSAAGTDQNRHFRQALTYWDMAASLVVHGALHEQLFVAASGEMFFLYAKCKPFIAAVRKETKNPNFMLAVEKVAEGSKEAKAKTAMFTERVQQRQKAQKAAGN